MASANDQDRKIIAVIDTGLNVEDPRFKDLICGYKDFTGEGIEDKNNHGTHVVGLIKQYAGVSNYCFLILKFYSDDEPDKMTIENMFNAMDYAVKHKASIVNISGGGGSFNEREYLLIKNHKKVLFIVAAGNDNKNLDKPENKYYPASYNLKNIIPVGSIMKDQFHFKSYSSNFGKIVKAWEIGDNVLSTFPNGEYGTMSGTSMATAIHTGKVINKGK